MKTFRLPTTNPEPLLNESVVAIGNFDGLHRGHQVLFLQLEKFAKEHRSPSVVFSFHPHPVNILRPEVPKIHPLLDERERAALLQKFGMDIFVQQEFAKNIAEKPAADFFENHILKTCHPKAIVVGHDFAFGRKREGNVEWLQAECKRRGIACVIQPAVIVDDVRVSSRHVRELLSRGEMELANRFLGFRYMLSGSVEHGQKLGRTIGFPTANLQVTKHITMPMGVYVVDVLHDGRRTRGALNIGVNPTVSETAEIKVEVHLIDSPDVDLYGKTIQMEFLHRLRSEKKFSSLDELKRQIQLDVQAARGYPKTDEVD